MSLLSASALAALRAAAEGAMTDTCNIQQATVSQDAIGQAAKTWSNVATGVACRLLFRGGQERDSGQRVSGAAEWAVWLPWDRDISREMRVVCNGHTFAVVADNTGATERAKTVAELVEVT